MLRRLSAAYFAGAVAGLLVAVAVVLTADAGWWVWQRHAPGEMRVTFLDVGQGDAAVAELTDGRVIVIDAGGFPGSRFDVGRAVVAPLALAGVEHADLNLDGVDMSPVLVEQQSLPDRPLYWASLSNRGSRAEAMRDGPWKLNVFHPKATPGTFENPKFELYRLDEDPSESTDLSGKFPDRARRMAQQITEWYRETTASSPEQPGGWLAVE